MDTINPNETYKDYFFPNWFDKEHFSEFLGKELTDKDFQDWKEFLGQESTIADIISSEMRQLLLDTRKDFNEWKKDR